MSAITTFSFDEAAVRVVDIEDQPWFVANDVCTVLGVDRTATRKLDDDEKGVHSMHTLGGGEQRAAIVNESGLYTLILRCRDATTPGTVAHRFRKWVTSEVLPAIRRTGRYGVMPTRESSFPIFDQSDVPFMIATNNLLRTAIRLHGPRAARPLWERFGLPPIDADPAAMVRQLEPPEDEDDEDNLSELVSEWTDYHDGFSLAELSLGTGFGENPPIRVRRRMGRILRLLGFEGKVQRNGEMCVQIWRREQTG